MDDLTDAPLAIRENEGATSELNRTLSHQVEFYDLGDNTSVTDTNDSTRTSRVEVEAPPVVGLTCASTLYLAR